MQQLVTSGKYCTERIILAKGFGGRSMHAEVFPQAPGSSGSEWKDI